MKQLPLFQRVIFVDWHGVLSRDPFWTSILESSTHPLRAQLEVKVSETFSCEPIMHSWMKGLIPSQDVISQMAIKMDRRFRQDFLNRQLDIDCARMRINLDLVGVLRKFRPAVPVVLATDNMDCFANTFNRIRGSRRRRSLESERLADWANICDDIICSSDVGVLKAEDPVGFFGSFLSEYGLQFSDALLIDDRADNCEAFRHYGGSTVQWKMGANDVSEAAAAVQNWLETPSRPTQRQV